MPDILPTAEEGMVLGVKNGRWTGVDPADLVTGQATGSVQIGLPDAHFTHTQIVASDRWEVQHNLGKLPAVTVIDSAQTQVLGDVIYLDLDRLEVRFSAPFSGVVVCN